MIVASGVNSIGAILWIGLIVGFVPSIFEYLGNPPFAAVWTEMWRGLWHDVLPINTQGTGWTGPDLSTGFYTLIFWGLWPLLFFGAAWVAGLSFPKIHSA